MRYSRPSHRQKGHIIHRPHISLAQFETNITELRFSLLFVMQQVLLYFH